MIDQHGTITRQGTVVIVGNSQLLVVERSSLQFARVQPDGSLSVHQGGVMLNFDLGLPAREAIPITTAILASMIDERADVVWRGQKMTYFDGPNTPPTMKWERVQPDVDAMVRSNYKGTNA